MLRLFTSFWRPPKLIADESTPARPTCTPGGTGRPAQRPKACSRAEFYDLHLAEQDSQPSIGSNVTIRRSTRGERLLTIDESSGKASVRLRHEETFTRRLYTTGESTFEWRKATRSQVASWMHAQQQSSDGPAPYRNFQGSILDEQTIAPGTLPQLQSEKKEIHSPDRLHSQLPQSQLQSISPYPKDSDPAMDRELSALAYTERARSEYTIGSSSSDDEMMELDDVDLGDTIRRRRKTEPIKIARRMISRHYTNIALSSGHPYATEPPPSRAACISELHQKVLRKAAARIAAARSNPT